MSTASAHPLWSIYCLLFDSEASAQTRDNITTKEDEQKLVNQTRDNITPKRMRKLLNQTRDNITTKEDEQTSESNKRQYNDQRG